ncbi:PilZ domain-containing protein [Shewanella sp. 1_MG-2023]|uniref:flagellar brake protein n=1 Tax=unclassified Shewanella TaxID=196818 RepID=UPI0026E33D01|nr:MULTISPECIES: PilZ domain-containing protein [unclassified Shewanella]MDO6610144.1 PilZ domain-containing protein [Shewanella sp. 7_MG-2023]MDO6769714.1 PilZ domain-containing protein [Shewanella sp. 2_MG-2023]MDO6792778.1 PilZ domain-containing protein [Shewanella sp. 1_MG-2023]
MPTKQITSKDGLSKEFKYLLAGTSVNIDIVSPAGQKGRFRTIFIGYLPEQFILIQFPDSNKLGNFGQYFVQGSEVIVRGLVEGHEASVIAFSSTIKQTLSTPTRMMALNFPDKMIIHNLRSTKRVLTELTASIKIKEESWGAQLTDVSLTGCHVEVSEGGQDELVEGETINIYVDGDDEPQISLIARICNAKTSEEGIKLGCQFISEQDKQVEKLVHIALLAEK